MFMFHFMANFVNTRKNFPDAQKLSGRQCRHADGIFLPLYEAKQIWRTGVVSAGTITAIVATILMTNNFLEKN